MATPEPSNNPRKLPEVPQGEHEVGKAALSPEKAGDTAEWATMDRAPSTSEAAARGMAKALQTLQRPSAFPREHDARVRQLA